MTRPILVVACKARDLSATLAESIRVDIHQQIDDLIAGSQRCEYVLTEAGEDALRERLVADVEPRFSAELDTREEP